MSHLILNVDDFEPQRYLRSSALRRAGHQVVEASTGAQAVALAREKRPALIVLDVHLPDIDGFEVCRQIKGDPSCGAILVLHVSSTFRDAASRTTALNNGADAYLAEPIEPDELVAHVNALLRISDAEKQARCAREALEEQRAQLEAVYQAMSDGASVFAMSGELVMVNEAVTRLVGDLSASSLGRALPHGSQSFELSDLAGVPIPVEQWPVSRVLRGESFDDCDLRVKRRDTGQEWIISYSARPVRDAAGQQTRPGDHQRRHGAEADRGSAEDK